MYKNGNYEVTVKGHHSAIKLRVKFDEQRLTDIDVVDEHETQEFVDELKSRFIPEVIQNQSLNVDEQFNASPWYLSPVAQGPFYAIENEVSAWSTMGGIKTDDECRALAKDNEVINGLFVIGTDNGSLMYSPYYDIPGFCYGSCIASGVIAGHGASNFANS